MQGKQKRKGQKYFRDRQKEGSTAKRQGLPSKFVRPESHFVRVRFTQGRSYSMIKTIKNAQKSGKQRKNGIYAIAR